MENKLLDDQEWDHHTDPWDEDTDDDGFSDYMEVRFRSDPLDSSDFPDGVYIFPIIGVILLTGGTITFIRYQQSHDYRFIHKVRDGIKEFPDKLKENIGVQKDKRETRKKKRNIRKKYKKRKK